MFWSTDTKVSIPSDREIDDFLSRGVNEVINKEEMVKFLKSGKKLRIKLGIDPTSPNIHIGRATVLWKMKFLQDLGHQLVLIVGDFTGVIGDTSDKESERPMLSEEEVSKNQALYFEQMGKIINLSKAEKHYNSKWLSKLNYKDITKHANCFSVSDFIARDNIKKRLESGSRVSLREVLYPLMQGYDSVEVKADVEMGGLDQRFNLLAGRALQEAFKQKPQQLVMLELLLGLDGRKMSSSWGNTVNIKDSADEMFGKIMSLKDNLIIHYFKLATDEKMETISDFEKKLSSGENPKNIKVALAKKIVSMYWGESKANEAEKNFSAIFSEGGVPENLEEFLIKEGESLVDLLLRSELVASKSEFARLVESKAVEILNEEKIIDTKALAKRGVVYKVGKRRFLKTR